VQDYWFEEAALMVEPSGHRAVGDVVSDYAAAKCRQSTESALKLCTDDFVLHTEALYSRVAGKPNVARLLDMFFHVFPDYRVCVADGVSNGYGYTCWGELEMTMHERLGPWAATHRTTNQPFFCVFTIRDGLLASEHFFFDRKVMCDALGLSEAKMGRLCRFAARLPQPVATTAYSMLSRL
jgi:hypothetical protein